MLEHALYCIEFARRLQDYHIHRDHDVFDTALRIHSHQ